MIRRDPGARIARQYGYKRSRHWPAARRAYLVRQPTCVACKKQYRGLRAWFVRLFTGTIVHHIVPFHVCLALDRPDLETDTRNLLTLCAGHHLVIGHLLNYEEFNLYAKACVLRCWGKTPEEVLHNPEFQRFAKDGYKAFSTWTGEQIADFRERLNDKFPPK